MSNMLLIGLAGLAFLAYEKNQAGSSSGSSSKPGGVDPSKYFPGGNSSGGTTKPSSSGGTLGTIATISSDIHGVVDDINSWIDNA